MSNATPAVVHVTVRLPEPLREAAGAVIELDGPFENLGDVIAALESRIPDFATTNDELYNFAVNGAMILHGERETPVRNGDDIEMVAAFSGG